MKASDIMRTSVAQVKPATRLVEAARLLLATNQRALPVVDPDGELVGILSEGDFLHRAEVDGDRHQNWLDALLNGSSYVQAHSLFVARVMTREPICVTPDTTLEDVISEMDINGIAQLPVLEDGVVVGLIGRLELLDAVTRRLGTNDEMPVRAAAAQKPEAS